MEEEREEASQSAAAVLVANSAGSSSSLRMGLRRRRRGGDGDGDGDGDGAAARPLEIETPPPASAAAASASASLPAPSAMGTRTDGANASTSPSSNTGSSGYNGDYLSDYETLLASNEGEGDVSRTVSAVVEDMRRKGGRPRRRRRQQQQQQQQQQQGDRNAARKVPLIPTSNRTAISPPEVGRTFSTASPPLPSSSSGGTSSGSDKSRRRRRNSSGTSTNNGSSSHSTVLDHHAESILQVDAHFRYSSAASCVVYVLLVLLSFRSCPAEQIQPLGGLERNASALAAILLFVSFVSTLLPLLYRGRTGSVSGVIVGALVVQTVAFTSNVLMATIAVPVVIDPVAGTRVHLLRWCEWAPLAFLMTFLTEAVGVPDGDADAAGGDSTSTSSSSSGKKNMSKTRDWRTDHLLAAYGNSLAQGLSTLCGFIFPFCPGFKSWMFCMLLSCALFLVIYYRLLVGTRRHRRMVCGTSVDEIELYSRSSLSLKLLRTCTFLWTALVLSYFLSTVGPIAFPNVELLQDGSLTMVSECVMDVAAKYLYMFIIVDVHDHVFDQGARAERRLEELRQMMAVVWDSSSDVIGISVRSVNGTVTTMLSPTYLKIYERRKEKLRTKTSNDPGTDQPQRENRKESQGNALIFELDANDFKRGGNKEEKEACSRVRGSRGVCNDDGGAARLVEPKIVYNIEFAAGSRRRKAPTPQGEDSEETARRRAYGNVTGYTARKRPDICAKELSSVAELVIRSWNLDSKDNTLLMQDLLLLQNEDDHFIRCETKVTRLEENALVIVVRDISERFHRFEAEKKVISETTAREKDAEANRFTRHEVKNGLLAAIGLCDSLHDSLIDKETSSNKGFMTTGRRAGDSSDVASTEKLGKLLSLHTSLSALQKMPLSSGGSSVTRLMTDLSRCLGELDKTLHEVLDTVLAEAMARDVIHEVYEPLLEEVDISSILCSSNVSVFDKDSRLERFPLLTHPCPLPLFAFDPQLLKYIHRNAVSNGCKYGRKGGLVLTEVHYDASARMFRMDVINLPGEHHEKILGMGEAASVAVFSPRKRLHSGFDRSRSRSEFIESHSSGDGAWIMHKCAKTLGGECSIKFETHRTVFSFRCPITTFEEAVNRNTSVHPSIFKLPENVWGIAIDDSKIQRKLLARFFHLAGVRDDRCIVQGGTMQEIKNFDDFVVNHIEQYPNDYVVVIADENLDAMNDDIMAKHTTVSGSKCIENIRRRLLPDQERRMLALVRSANDSSRDVAIYCARAHGFLPKAPIKRQRVLEMLAPAWEKRFPPGGWADEDAHTDSVEPCVPSLEAEPADSDEDLDLLVDMSELRGEVEELHVMCSADEELLAERWQIIWERLHALKGDLKSLPSNGRAAAAVEMITSLRGTTLPPNFKERWVSIHSLIKSLWS